MRTTRYEVLTVVSTTDHEVELRHAEFYTLPQVDSYLERLENSPTVVSFSETILMKIQHPAGTGYYMLGAS